MTERNGRFVPPGPTTPTVKRSVAGLCLALVLVAAGGCAGPGEVEPCPDGTDHFVRYELFMGRSGPGGEVVDDAAWEGYLRETVTPRFPDGLTALDARGQWRDADGAIQRERSKLLVILASPGDDVTSRIDELVADYKRRFSQESVLVAVEDTCVAFK